MIVSNRRLCTFQKPPARTPPTSDQSAFSAAYTASGADHRDEGRQQAAKFVPTKVPSGA